MTIVGNVAGDLVDEASPVVGGRDKGWANVEKEKRDIEPWEGREGWVYLELRHCSTASQRGPMLGP